MLTSLFVEETRPSVPADKSQEVHKSHTEGQDIDLATTTSPVDTYTTATSASSAGNVEDTTSAAVMTGITGPNATPSAVSTSLAALPTVTGVANVSQSTAPTAPTVPTAAPATAQYVGQQNIGTATKNRNGKRGSSQISSSKESVSEESAPKRMRGETGIAIPITGQQEGPPQSSTPWSSADTLPPYDDLTSASDSGSEPNHDHQTAAAAQDLSTQQSHDDGSSKEDQTAAPSQALPTQLSNDDGPSKEETTTQNPTSRYFLRSKLDPSEEALKAAAAAPLKKQRRSGDAPKKGMEGMFPRPQGS